MNRRTRSTIAIAAALLGAFFSACSADVPSGSGLPTSSSSSSGGSTTGGPGPVDCAIGGRVVANGVVNPTDSCQICDVAAFSSGWSSLADFTPCTDDGGTLCLAGQCQFLCSIGGSAVAAGAANPGNPCQTCQPAVALGNFVNGPDLVSCAVDGGNLCVAGQCQAGCAIDGGFVASGALDPTTGCGSCQPALALDRYTVLPDFGPCSVDGGNFCVGGQCQLGCAIDGGLVPPWTFADPAQSSCCNPALASRGWTPAFARASLPVALAAPPAGLCAGDFNGDGRADLALLFDQGSAAVLFSSGDGGFAGRPASQGLLGLVSQGVACADFDGDGRADLAMLLGTVMSPSPQRATGIALAHTGADGALIDAGFLPSQTVYPLAFSAGSLDGNSPPSFALVEGAFPFGGSLGVWVNSASGHSDAGQPVGWGNFSFLAVSTFVLSPSRVTFAPPLSVPGLSAVVVQVPISGVGQGSEIFPYDQYLNINGPNPPPLFTAPLQLDAGPISARVGAHFTDAFTADLVDNAAPGLVQRINDGFGNFTVGPTFAGNFPKLLVFRRAGADADTVIGISGPAATVFTAADGGLAYTATYSTAASTATDAALGDFNGDQLIDLAIADRAQQAVYLLNGQCR